MVRNGGSRGRRGGAPRADDSVLVVVVRRWGAQIAIVGVLEGSAQLGGSGRRLFVYGGTLVVESHWGDGMWRIVVVEESGAQIVVRRRERSVDSGSEGRQYMGDTNGDRWCLGGSRRTRGSWCEDSERYNISASSKETPEISYRYRAWCSTAVNSGF